MNTFVRIAPAGRLIAALLMVVGTLHFGSAMAAFKEKDPEPPKADPAKPTVRMEIATPLKAAQALLKDKKYAEALVEIAKTDAFAEQTPHEVYVINHLRGVAAAFADQKELAVKSLQASLATGRFPPADFAQTYEVMSGLYYKMKDYKNAAVWANKALNEAGSTNAETRYVLAYSSFLQDDFATTIKETSILVADAEKAGKVPVEGQLRMLASSYNKIKDIAGYAAALEKLVTLYPKREYWADVVYRAESAPKFSDRLVLDSFRLKLYAGLLASGGEYTEMADAAMQSGYSIEAQKVLEAAQKPEVERTAGDITRHKKLMETVAKDVAEEKKRMARGEASATKTALALVNNGFNYVLNGDSAKGLAMMEEGVKMPGLKYPDEARLRFGVALVYAGQKDKAIEVFNTIKGADGTGDLAHLWTILVKQPPKS
ncbi:MAG: hypothetical protein HY255_00340 [Betaproteobacteria bacterium]|nr:hypothetical protein [Betaproteobacteria bacterium]